MVLNMFQKYFISLLASTLQMFNLKSIIYLFFVIYGDSTRFIKFLAIVFVYRKYLIDNMQTSRNFQILNVQSQINYILVLCELR